MSPVVRERHVGRVAFVLLSASWLLFPADPAASQERGAALRILAENVTALQDQDRRAAGPSAPLVPGDVVRYTLVLTNTTAGDIRNVEFVDPIPTGLVIELGTAGAEREDVTVEFSIDGGNTWSLEPQVQEQVEGRTVTRPAPAERYTHVRWRVQGFLPPAAEVTAWFRARLPAR